MIFVSLETSEGFRSAFLSIAFCGVKVLKSEEPSTVDCPGLFLVRRMDIFHRYRIRQFIPLFGLIARRLAGLIVIPEWPNQPENIIYSKTQRITNSNRKWNW